MSLFSALAGPVASFASSAFDAMGARKAAKKQYDREKSLSNTAHWREVKDLRHAGLNPILSVNHGGASTPSVSAAQTGQFSAGMSNANSARSISNQKELQNSQMEQIAKAMQLTDAQIDNAHADTILKTNSAKVASNQASLIGFQLPKAANLAEVENSVLGKYGAYGDRGGQILNSVMSGLPGIGSLTSGIRTVFHGGNSARALASSPRKGFSSAMKSRDESMSDLRKWGLIND